MHRLASLRSKLTQKEEPKQNTKEAVPKQWRALAECLTSFARAAKRDRSTNLRYVYDKLGAFASRDVVDRTIDAADVSNDGDHLQPSARRVLHGGEAAARGTPKIMNLVDDAGLAEARAAAQLFAESVRSTVPCPEGYNLTTTRAIRCGAPHCFAREGAHDWFSPQIASSTGSGPRFHRDGAHVEAERGEFGGRAGQELALLSPRGGPLGACEAIARCAAGGGALHRRGAPLRVVGVQVSVLVAGPDLERAMELFGTVVLREALQASESERCIVLALETAGVATGGPTARDALDVLQNTTTPAAAAAVAVTAAAEAATPARRWRVARLKKRRDAAAFTTALKASTIKKNAARLALLLRCPGGLVRVEATYALHFAEPQRPVRAFSAEPAASILDGVFPTDADAEAYASRAAAPAEDVRDAVLRCQRLSAAGLRCGDKALAAAAVTPARPQLAPGAAALAAVAADARELRRGARAVADALRVIADALRPKAANRTAHAFCGPAAACALASDAMDDDWGLWQPASDDVSGDPWLFGGVGAGPSDAQKARSKSGLASPAKSKRPGTGASAASKRDDQDEETLSRAACRAWLHVAEHDFMKWRDRAVDYARRAGAAQDADDVDTVFLASVLRQDLAAVSEGGDDALRAGAAARWDRLAAAVALERPDVVLKSASSYETEDGDAPGLILGDGEDALGRVGLLGAGRRRGALAAAAADAHRDAVADVHLRRDGGGLRLPDLARLFAGDDNAEVLHAEADVDVVDGPDGFVEVAATGDRVVAVHGVGCLGMDARAVAALIDASLQQPKTTDDEAWFADATQSAKPPQKPKPLRLERPGNAPLDDWAPARHVLSAALHAAATRLERIGGLFGVAERGLDARAWAAVAARAADDVKHARLERRRRQAAAARAERRRARGFEGDAAVAPEPVEAVRDPASVVDALTAVAKRARGAAKKLREAELAPLRAEPLPSSAPTKIEGGDAAAVVVKTGAAACLARAAYETVNDAWAPALYRVAVAAYRGANVQRLARGATDAALCFDALGRAPPEPGKEPVRMRAEADAARFTESAAAARAAAEAQVAELRASLASAQLALQKAAGFGATSAAQVRRELGAALRLADAKTARFAAHAAARSLDERSATRRAAALRAQPSAVGGVWACEGVYGTRRAVACVSRNARLILNRLTNALLPRGPTMTPTFNEEAPNLRAHVALRGDASSYIRAQLDVLATCRTPEHSKNAPRAGAAACVELAAALDDADVAQGLFGRAKPLRKAARAAALLKRGGLANIVRAAAKKDPVEAAAPKQELLLVAVAAGPGADRWGGGALRFGSGALATRAGRERALKDIGRLQLVFGGQCPLGLHALLPVDKTYVAVVLRVALWQIGPAADASRNNLLVDASARENVSASSEGAQALAATAASLKRGDHEGEVAQTLSDIREAAESGEWRRVYALDRRLALAGDVAATSAPPATAPAEALRGLSVAPLEKRLAAHARLLDGVVQDALRLEGLCGALRALLVLPKHLRTKVSPQKIADHAQVVVDGVDALVASPQSVHFSGAGRSLAGKLRGSDATAPGLVVTSLAAAAAARLADADVSEGRHPANATKVAGARAQAAALALLREAADFSRALGEAAAANAHAGDFEMAVHVAALRWGAAPVDAADGPEDATSPGVPTPRGFFD